MVNKVLSSIVFFDLKEEEIIPVPAAAANAACR
jgi:hypothetical protein